MAIGTVMKKIVVKDKPAPASADEAYVARVSGISPQTRKVLLLIGASIALSATATGVALMIANREAVGERLRLASARASQGFVQLSRACGNTAKQLTDQVTRR